MLRSALERPINKWQYEQPDMPELAAAYAFGLAKNHAFVDGNKRIAFMAMMVFLLKNGLAFSPDPAQATTMILALAAGEVSEESLTRWIRDNWPADRRMSRSQAIAGKTTARRCPAHRLCGISTPGSEY